MKKKLLAFLVVLSTLVSLLPNCVMAAYVTETSVPNIPGVTCYGGAGSFGAATGEVSLAYKGGVKKFNGYTYICTPYKEFNMFNKDEVVGNGPLADYDKIEFYLALADDSSATDGASVVFWKWSDGGKNGGQDVKLKWEGVQIDLKPGEEARKVTVDLQGYDSMNFVIKELKATESDQNPIKIVFGDFKAYKSTRSYDRYASMNADVKGYFGGINQTVAGSYQIAVNSGAPYYIEPKFSVLDGTTYSAMEFYLGTAEWTKVEDVEQYALVDIFTTTDSAYNSNTNSAEYVFKVGAEPQLVTLPIPTGTGAMKWIVKHGYINNGQFVSFKADDGKGVTSGSFKLGVFDVKLYKNKNAFISSFSSAWNKVGTAQNQTMLFKDDGSNKYSTFGNIKDWWAGKADNFTVGDVKGSFFYEDGRFWSQDITRNRNDANASGTMTMSFVTEGYIDRFTGRFGVATGQATVKADTDYIVVKGYNWKNPQVKDINDNFAGTNGSKGTVLYSAYAMPDGFDDAFDIDTSGYDYIKIFTNFTGTRRASLMNYAFHQYDAKDINATFDSQTGIITSSSKQPRSAGTMVAVSYVNDKPNGVVYNNAAPMGEVSEVISARNDCTQSADVLAKYSLDCSEILSDVECIKYYYVDGQALQDLTIGDLSVLNDSNYVATYELPYKKIKSLKKTESGYSAEIAYYTGNAVIIAASYDSNNKLTGISVGDSKAINGEGTLNVDFTAANAEDDIKVFIWDGVASVMPIFASRTVE